MTQKEFWQRHPADYIPPDRGVPEPEVSGRFQDPQGWIGEINPERFTPGRDVNCGECARATELSWRGVPAVSARNTDSLRFGEPPERMEEWSREQLDAIALDDIRATLDEAGPGASALIAVYWKHGGGHWFNAVNHEGGSWWWTASGGVSSRGLRVRTSAGSMRAILGSRSPSSLVQTMPAKRGLGD